MTKEKYREKYKKIFENKKITIMGLGLLGRGIQVTEFLAECGAMLTVTDLKSEIDLKTSIDILRSCKNFDNIKFVLGHHNLEDFENKDMIIKAAGVALSSLYIDKAKENNIPIKMDASLFAEIVREVFPNVKIIGITGTRGKSTTTALIYHILKSHEDSLKAKIHLGGNMRSKATLPLLKIVEPNDICVLELDSWQLQGFGDAKISPNISVFTNLMPDHMNYYAGDMAKYLEDKMNIFKYQKNSDTLVTDKEMLKVFTIQPNGKIFFPEKIDIQKISKNILGAHNVKNAELAFAVAKEVGLRDDEIYHSLESFAGLEGRLQIVKELNGITIINDNNATTPEATTVGIQAIHDGFPNANIILICGGSTKKLDLKRFAGEINKNVKYCTLLSGSGTTELLPLLKVESSFFENLEETLKNAVSKAHPGDVILFSPAFTSFGHFNNEYDRNDQFLELVKKLT